MDIKEVKTEIENTAKELKQKFDEAKNDMASKKEFIDLKEAVEKIDLKKVSEETKSQLEGMKADIQKQIDEVGLQITKLGKNVVNSTKTFKDALMDAFKDEQYQKFVKGEIPQTRPMQIKVAADMLESTHLTDGTAPVILPDRRTNPLMYVDRMLNLRDVVYVGNTDSNLIDFLKESGFEDGTAMTAEGIAKGQSDFDLVEASVKVETLATCFTVSNQMLKDIPYLASYIATRATKKIFNKEDQQMLFGTGTSPQIEGITINATAFAAGNWANAITEANEYDVLRRAFSQLSVAYYKPSAVLMNPDDAALMDVIKATDGQYVRPGFMRLTNGQLVFNGIPVIETTAVTARKYIIGDFMNGCQLLYNEGVNVQFSQSHSDNFTKNKTTIRIEERIAFPIYRNEAFIYGDFDTDIAAIQASS